MTTTTEPTDLARALSEAVLDMTDEEHTVLSGV